MTVSDAQRSIAVTKLVASAKQNKKLPGVMVGRHFQPLCLLFQAIISKQIVSLNMDLWFFSGSRSYVFWSLQMWRSFSITDRTAF